VTDALLHIKVIKRSAKSNRLSRARSACLTGSEQSSAVIGRDRTLIAQLKELPRWGRNSIAPLSRLGDSRHGSNVVIVGGLERHFRTIIFRN